MLLPQTTEKCGPEECGFCKEFAFDELSAVAGFLILPIFAKKEEENVNVCRRSTLR